MNTPTVEQKVNFFENFKVEVDSLATQTLVFMPGNQSFSYEDVDVYGETQFIRLMTQDDNETIIEIEFADEEVFVDEMCALFVELNNDVAAFARAAFKKYEKQNLT